MRWILVVMLIVGCGGKKKASTQECEQACEHVLGLARADLDKSIGKMGEMGGEVGAKLRAQAEASTASDLATCTAQCQKGKLDPTCALAAKSIDGAMSCAGSAGGGPIEAPSERSEADWPNATLRAVEDEIGGVKFSIQIPNELQAQEADRSAESRGWDFPGQPFSQPRFRIDLGPAFPATVEDGVAYVDPGDDEILHQELVDDRFTLVYRSKTYVVAKVLIRAGDRSLECYGTHSSSAGVEEPGVLGSWLADVCATARVR